MREVVNVVLCGDDSGEPVSLPEWSKGLRSGRNVFERVGSNPTADISYLLRIAAAPGFVHARHHHGRSFIVEQHAPALYMLNCIWPLVIFYVIQLSNALDGVCVSVQCNCACAIIERSVLDSVRMGLTQLVVCRVLVINVSNKQAVFGRL